MASKKAAAKVEAKSEQKAAVQRVAEQKPEPKPQPKRKEREDVSASTRAAVLKALEAAGFKGAERGGWIRFNVRAGKVSVAAKGPQVHFRGFEFQHPGVEQITDNEAKKRHLGSVRQVLWLDRQTEKVVADVIRTAIK